MPFRIECGKVNLSSTIDDGVTATVNFENSYTNPVVIVYIPTRGGNQSIVPQVRNLTGNSCDIFMEECDNETHNAEDVHYIVVEEGAWEFPDGTLLEAGIHNTSTVHTGGTSYPYGDTVSFNQSFSAAPVVLASVNTYNTGAHVTCEVSATSSTDFQLALEELETGISVSAEDIGWLAIQEGQTGTISNVPYESKQEARDGSKDGYDNTAHNLDFTQSFASAPLISVQCGPFDANSGSNGAYARGEGTLNTTDHKTFAEEDDCGDTDRSHADEPFGFLAFESAFSYRIAVSVSDSATGSETISTMVPVSDLGAGAGSFYGEASLKKSDLGTGTEVWTLMQALSDSGAGVDTLSDLSAAVKKADSGAGAETLSYREIGLLDTGAGGEELTELVNAVTDLASGVDTLSELAAAVKEMDPGSGLEAVDLTASVEGLDTGAGTGALTGLEALVEKAEVGVGVEELTELAVLVKETDTGSGVEKVFAPIRVVRDTATGENYVLTVEVPEHAEEIDENLEKLIRLLEIKDLTG